MVKSNHEVINIKEYFSLGTLKTSLFLLLKQKKSNSKVALGAGGRTRTGTGRPGGF